ncbi:MAG: acetate--CoA ligase family protein [Patescibacteria group bacterium]|jgi:acyl-CoA synthetase (NDP forming)|nr:acetate--CoA ligase family protein [bacterium]HQC49863.1 acetate--CoA ligase family protein [bacterium]
MNLKNFFTPSAIAVVGASQNPKKVGRQVLDNIISSGYQGKIFPINLQEKTIASLPVFSDLEKLPIKDWSSLLVMIVIPAAFVLPEIEKCGRLGIKNIIIISAGFKESDAKGKKREAELKVLINKYGLNVLGPNCLGFINNFNHFNASFSHRANINSKVAFISQSGAIGSSVLDWLKAQNLGLGYFISLGNKAGLNENDFLEYLGKDKNIDSIILYLEEVADGEKFMQIVSQIVPEKTVAILKAGTSASGQALAKSHTGALAGESMATKIGLKRAGAILIDNLNDLFNLVIILRSPSVVKNKLSNKLQIITNAGGLAVLSADAAAEQDINLVGNFDLFGNASPEDYEKALKKSLNTNKETNILILLSPQLGTEPLRTAEVIAKLAKQNPKRLIMTSFLGGDTIAEAREYLISEGLPFFSYPEEAIKSLGALIKNAQNLSQFTPYNSINYEVVAEIKKKKDYDYLELFALLNKYKIKSVKTLKYNPRIKEKLTFPLVLKAVGPDFNHKSDKKAIVLNLNNLTELKTAAEKLQQKYKTAFSKQDNYLVIQPQIKDKLELILGFKQDASFGPVLLFGLGGIYAEILKEVKLTIADLDEKRALEFIKESAFFPILNGARGGIKYDIHKLAKVLVNFSHLANQNRQIKEFDINPLFLTAQEILAADVRAF